MHSRFLKIFFLSASLLLTANCIAQVNLVPNGGFETFTTCPTVIGQVDIASGWQILSQTPDYFNSCSTNTCSCGFPAPICAGVPNNCFGFQYASSGNGYVGLATYASATSNYREILGTQLTNSLTIGQKYFVKFKIAFTWGNPGGYNPNTAADKLGVRFSTVLHNSVTALPPINNFAHVYSISQIADTTNWTIIFKSFVADSNYKFIEVGNFFNDANTMKSIQYIAGSDLSYYYFDDLCVSTDSLFTSNFQTGIQENREDKFVKIFPNPCYNGVIRFNKLLNNAEISLINLLGEKVQTSFLSNVDNFQINIPEGIYFIRIDEGDRFVSQKIIIKKN